MTGFVCENAVRGIKEANKIHQTFELDIKAELVVDQMNRNSQHMW